MIKLSELLDRNVKVSNDQEMAQSKTKWENLN